MAGYHKPRGKYIVTEGSDSFDYDEEVYESQAAEGILSTLDYLISLGDQDSEQDTEEQNPQTDNEFDFENAYADYLSDDDGYDDDYDDEDEEYFGLSMWTARFAHCFA